MKIKHGKFGVGISVGALFLILAFQNCAPGMRVDDSMESDPANASFKSDSAPITCGDYVEGDTWFENSEVADVAEACPAGSTGSNTRHVMMQDQYLCQNGLAVGTGVSRQGLTMGQDVNCWSVGPNGNLPDMGAMPCGTQPSGSVWWVDTGQTQQVKATCAYGGTLTHIYIVEVMYACNGGLISKTASTRSTTLKQDTGSCYGQPSGGGGGGWSGGGGGGSGNGPGGRGGI